MKYKSFFRRFFEESDKFNEIYLSAYNSDSTIRFNILINKHPAFLVINSEVLTCVEDIYSLNGKIIEKTKGNRNLPIIALNWLITYSLIEEIKITNEIEGVASTRKQLKELLKTKSPKKYVRLYGMVNKYRKLLDDNDVEIINNQNVRELYNEILIQDIQNEDLNDIPDGMIYRKDAVEVDKGGITIHEGIMPEEKIIDTMSNALNILNDLSINLLVRVAVFHYLFGYIHPFYEGNGRMSRFISTSYLCKKLDILSALQLSISCKKNQKQYYDSFKITNDVRNKGDLTYFVLSFLEIIKDGLDDLIKKIDEKTEQYTYYYDRIRKTIVDHKVQDLLCLLLQATLFDFEGLTIKELVKYSDFSDSTVRNYLKRDEVIRIINENSSEKPFRYSLDLDKL